VNEIREGKVRQRRAWYRGGKLAWEEKSAFTEN
jgi:hypothetical protein